MRGLPIALPTPFTSYVRIWYNPGMEMSATAAVGGRLFASTSWTLILEAGGSESSDQTRGALTQLCSIYWRPASLFLSRPGYNWHDADDLAEGFFADVIEAGVPIQRYAYRGRVRYA